MEPEYAPTETSPEELVTPGEHLTPTDQARLASLYHGVTGRSLAPHQPPYEIGGVKIPGMVDEDNPIYRIVYGGGEKWLEVKVERDAQGNSTGNWITVGGNARLYPTTHQTNLELRTIRLPGGATRQAWFDPKTGEEVRPATTASGEQLGAIAAAVRAGGPTPEQRAATLEHTQAETELARARLGQVGQKPELDEITAAHVAAQTREIEQKLLPPVQQLIQHGLDTIAYLRDRVANGDMSAIEAGQAAEQVHQNVQAGLAGYKSAADQEEQRQKQVMERARVGQELLNRRIESGVNLAQSMMKEYESEISKPGPAMPGGRGSYNPLDMAQSIMESYGAGPELTDFARNFLSGTGSIPQIQPSGIDWASLLSARGEGGGGMMGEESPIQGKTPAQLPPEEASPEEQ